MPSNLFDFDILIAGAGPAGCAAAYDLARAGKRVLLLDRRSFPRHKACACGLTRKTLAALRYSVEPVVERICHEIVLQGDAAAEVRVRTRSPICAMAVRERFDAFCLQQTLSMGAELLKIETITALREGPTHVELDIQTAEGARTLTASALVGADGSNGQTRRLATTGTTQDPPGTATDSRWRPAYPTLRYPRCCQAATRRRTSSSTSRHCPAATAGSFPRATTSTSASAPSHPLRRSRPPI